MSESVKTTAQLLGDRIWYDVPSAAKVLGIHPITLYRWVESGRLPNSSVRRIGRSVRIARDFLLQAVDI